MKRTIKYNLIRSSRKTVNDYLQNLKSDELQAMYSSSFTYELKVPDLMKKIQNELQRRNIAAQPMLFS
ncbi:MAG: hypothetical protein KIS94_00585 [Chitinophagales bacterium]|nr:hypothetical protein [Chitinophagales bacterium]